MPQRASENAVWPTWSPAVCGPLATPPMPLEPSGSPAGTSAASAPPPSDSPPAERLARRVARAVGTFEYGLLGRPPASVTVVGSSLSMVVHLHELFSPLEQQLARQDDASAERVRAFHRSLFDRTVDDLLEHVWLTTGVMFRGAIAHVDTATASVLKTLATHPDLDLFVLGAGLPALGVPVDIHRRIRGGVGPGGVDRAERPLPVTQPSGSSQAAGNGAVHR